MRECQLCVHFLSKALKIKLPCLNIYLNDVGASTGVNQEGAGRKRIEKRKSQLQQGERCPHLEGRATGLSSLWLACQGRAPKTPPTFSEDGALALPLPCLCVPGCPWLNLAVDSGACWALGVPIEPIHSCRNYLLNARCVHRSLQLVRTG